MYYKIANTGCEVYKKLHAMRTEEIEMEAQNIQDIKDKTGLEWSTFLGIDGQQTFNRVSEYGGFTFKEPDKVNLKIWKRHTEHKNIFVPNARTKEGREMRGFLNNGLKGHKFSMVFEILGVKQPIGRFTFPFIEIYQSGLILYFDENVIPKDPNIIEITSKEFYTHLNPESDESKNA